MDIVEKYYVRHVTSITTGRLVDHQKYNDEWITDIKNRGDVMKRSTNLKCNMTGYRDLLEDDKYNVLKNFAMQIASKQNNFSVNKEYYIDDLWGAVYNQNDKANSHAHYPADFSFVYYVKADPSVSSPLLFPDVENFLVYPASGLFVMFPGYLYHKVPPQKYDNERIVIAGNIQSRNK